MMSGSADPGGARAISGVDDIRRGPAAGRAGEARAERVEVGDQLGRYQRRPVCASRCGCVVRTVAAPSWSRVLEPQPLAVPAGGGEGVRIDGGPPAATATLTDRSRSS
jgi:hypothetical protein